MHVDSVGQSLPMPHNEDVAEHEDTTEHGEDAAQALSPSLTHGAEVAAGDGERERSHSTPTTFSHPASTTIPTRKESVRCALCVQALCKRRFECNGRINRAWSKCKHPPLVGKKKVRWSEAEVKRRIALLEAGQGSNHA